MTYRQQVSPCVPLWALAAVVIVAWATAVRATEIQVPVHYDSLPNGLKCIIVPDTNVAVVSCRLYYFVGSMYEGPGTTGLSHMFEHMMFKGTQHLGTRDYAKEVPIMAAIDTIDAKLQRLRQDGVPDNDPRLAQMRTQITALLDQQRKYIVKDEIWDLYQRNGGTNLNAWTGEDMTAYLVTLPMNKVELFYWIESDRMRDPVLREFNSEREVVIEERLMRDENNPVNRYWERLWALFQPAHPYRQPTIGWMSDIRAYTRAKLEEHVRRYYTPDNAVIVLTGNINPSKAMQQIGRYFGTIPRAKQPKQEVVTRDPAPIGQTRFIVRDDAEPRIDILFQTPGYPNDSLYRLDVVEGVLNGRSGRLYKRLVIDDELCTDAGASNDFRLHNGYFQVWASPKADVNPDTVEKILFEEVRKLAKQPPTAREAERIKNDIQMSFVNGLTSLEGLSDRLAWFQRLRSWKDLFTYPDSIVKVEPQSVPQVVAHYLREDHATVGLLLPKAVDGGQRAKH